MIATKKEFAQIWKKESDELTRLDYFIFLLINELDLLLNNENSSGIFASGKYRLNQPQIADLALQLGDGLQFFYEQMCYGNGCSLGCPNKLNIPFSKNEDDLKFEIIKQEFNGNADACKSREDCLRHDLMNYVVKDTLADFYGYNMNMEISEEDPLLLSMADFIVTVIIRFTIDRGSELLKEPYKNAGSLFN